MNIENTIHATLQGKGGVGKSLVASLVHNWMRSRGVEPAGFDVDTENDSYRRVRGLGVEHVDLLVDSDIDPGRFDALLERTFAEQAPIIIDAGANSFRPLVGYLKTYNILEHLHAAGKRFFVHTVVTGDDARDDTVKGVLAIASDLPAARVILWANEYKGRIMLDGQPLADSWLLNSNGNADHPGINGQLAGVVLLPYVPGDLLRRDVQLMRERCLTVEEYCSDATVPLMSRIRIKGWVGGIYDNLDEVTWS